MIKIPPKILRALYILGEPLHYVLGRACAKSVWQFHKNDRKVFTSEKEFPACDEKSPRKSTRWNTCLAYSTTVARIKKTDRNIARSPTRARTSDRTSSLPI